jgi:hypothetical protein
MWGVIAWSHMRRIELVITGDSMHYVPLDGVAADT